MGYIESLLGEGERVLYVTRHHWILLLKRCWAFTLLFVVGLALTVAGNLFAGPALHDLGLTPDQALLARLVVGVLLLAYPGVTLVLRYLFWRDDRFIVTNFRVIHAEGILSKTVIDSSLEKVNDVLLRQSFLGRLLGYGHLEILTSSDIGVNELSLISRTLEFKKAMLDAKHALEGARAGNGSRQGRIPDLLARLAELRDKQVITQEEFEAEKAQLLADL